MPRAKRLTTRGGQGRKRDYYGTPYLTGIPFQGTDQLIRHVVDKKT